MQQMPGSWRVESMEVPEDQMLFGRFLDERDYHALETLLQRHADRAYTLAYRLTGSQVAAEDALQEAALRLLKQSSGHQTTVPFMNWWLQLVSCAARDWRRREQRRQRHNTQLHIEIEPIANQDQNSLSQSDESIRGEHIEHLRQTVGQLPERYRQVVELFYFAGFTQREVAAQLKQNEGTVASQLNRARQALRRRLGRRGEVSLALLASFAGAPLHASTSASSLFSAGQLSTYAAALPSSTLVAQGISLMASHPILSGTLALTCAVPTFMFGVDLLAEDQSRADVSEQAELETNFSLQLGSIRETVAIDQTGTVELPFGHNLSQLGEIEATPDEQARGYARRMGRLFADHQRQWIAPQADLVRIRAALEQLAQAYDDLGPVEREVLAQQTGVDMSFTFSGREYQLTWPQRSNPRYRPKLTAPIPDELVQTWLAMDDKVNNVINALHGARSNALAVVLTEEDLDQLYRYFLGRDLEHVTDVAELRRIMHPAENSLRYFANADLIARARAALLVNPMSDMRREYFVAWRILDEAARRGLYDVMADSELILANLSGREEKLWAQRDGYCLRLLADHGRPEIVERLSTMHDQVVDSQPQLAKQLEKAVGRMAQQHDVQIRRKIMAEMTKKLSGNITGNEADIQSLPADKLVINGFVNGGATVAAGAITAVQPDQQSGVDVVQHDKTVKIDGNPIILEFEYKPEGSLDINN